MASQRPDTTQVARTVIALIACLWLSYVVVVPTSSMGAPRADVAAGVKKCRHFTSVRIRHGRQVHKRVTKCVQVPSKACRVTWKKKKRHGRIVIRNRNPVW